MKLKIIFLFTIILILVFILISLKETFSPKGYIKNCKIHHIHQNYLDCINNNDCNNITKCIKSKGKHWNMSIIPQFGDVIKCINDNKIMNKCPTINGNANDIVKASIKLNIKCPHLVKVNRLCTPINKFNGKKYKNYKECINEAVKKPKHCLKQFYLRKFIHNNKISSTYRSKRNTETTVTTPTILNSVNTTRPSTTVTTASSPSKSTQYSKKALFP